MVHPRHRVRHLRRYIRSWHVWTGHAHVVGPHPHDAQRSRVQWWNRGRRPLALRKCATHVAAPVHRLGEERVPLIGPRLDDDIVRLRYRDADLIHRNRLNVLSVRLDDGHLQPGDFHVEVRHGRCIDDAQTHAFSRSEDACPVFSSGPSVQKIRIGRATHVRDVRGIHPHSSPHFPISEGGTGVFEQTADKLW